MACQFVKSNHKTGKIAEFAPARASFLSWLFDLALYASRAFPGTTGRGVVALMPLHVIAAVITVLLLRVQGLPRA